MVRAHRRKQARKFYDVRVKVTSGGRTLERYTITSVYAKSRLQARQMVKREERRFLRSRDVIGKSDRISTKIARERE